MNSLNRKTYGDCHLYNKYPKYNEILFRALMSNTPVDKESDEFKGLIYDIKRAKLPMIAVTMLESDKTELIIPDKPLPVQFKVFYAKDPKTKQKKLYITVNSLEEMHTNLGYMISSIISGYWMVYYTDSKHISKISAQNNGVRCFASLFTHIIDYIGKISVIEGARDKCMLYASIYCLTNIYGNDEYDLKAIGKFIGLTETKASIYMMNIKDDSFDDIESFVALIKKEFKIDKLTLNLIVEKWMYLYGQSTVFALEYFPALATMISDAYVGAYINNQKTIEKICGQQMVAFGKMLSNM